MLVKMIGRGFEIIHLQHTIRIEWANWMYAKEHIL